MKFLSVFFFLAFFTLGAQAQECASNTEELKDLIGNSGLAMSWVENTNKADRRLTLKLANSGGGLSLDLAVPAGNWAHVKGVICKVGPENFVAKVSSMTWGPQAPGLVKMAGKPSTIKLQLLYPTVLKVTAKGMSFQFNAR